MKKSLQKDTLAYQFGMRPGVLHRNMGSVDLPGVVTSLNKFMAAPSIGSYCSIDFTENPKGNPERDGMVFYMLNHAVSIIRQKMHPYERLAQYLPIVEQYHQQLALRSARMFFYLLLICTRESRHEKTSPASSFWTSLQTEFGAPIYKFYQTIRGTSSHSAAQTLRDNPPATKLALYTRFLVKVFYSGSFSGGYGGKAWGQVADVLHNFVIGTISAEMMMDTAFTLCHNNGPIFNKGMLFDGYSQEIYKILDVQRSGQIPQLVANNETPWASDPVVRGIWESCRKVLGDAFIGHVDWFLVEELGSLHQYPTQKQKQTATHGHPAKHKAKVEAEKLKKELAEKIAAEEAKNMIEIMPGLKIKKVEVPR